MVKKKDENSIEIIKQASDLAIVETFFERLPQLFIQIYAFLYEFNFVYDNHLLLLFASFFELNDSQIYTKNIRALHQNITNSTRAQHISDVNFQFSYLIILSMNFSIVSSIYAIFSDYLISRKTFFLKSSGPMRFYELSYGEKFSYFFIYAINISTRILVINISFQLILLLSIHAIWKFAIFVLLIFLKPVLFFRYSIDYCMWTAYNVKIDTSIEITNRCITYFRIVNYYPMIIYAKHGVEKRKNEIKRFSLSFGQFLFDLIFVLLVLCVNFYSDTLDKRDVIFYFYFLLPISVSYIISNLIQFKYVINDEYDWAGKFCTNRRGP
jgi:hypothetical protein